MCKAISDIRLEERTTALAESKVEDILNIMDTLGFTFEQAATALKIPADQYNAYREMVEAAQG